MARKLVAEYTSKIISIKNDHYHKNKPCVTTLKNTLQYQYLSNINNAAQNLLQIFTQNDY